MQLYCMIIVAQIYFKICVESRRYESVETLILGFGREDQIVLDGVMVHMKTEECSLIGSLLIYYRY